jgi:hypothetical protein
MRCPTATTGASAFVCQQTAPIVSATHLNQAGYSYRTQRRFQAFHFTAGASQSDGGIRWHEVRVLILSTTVTGTGVEGILDNMRLLCSADELGWEGEETNTTRSSFFLLLAPVEGGRGFLFPPSSLRSSYKSFPPFLSGDTDFLLFRLFSGI